MTLEPCHHIHEKQGKGCSQWIQARGVETVIWGAHDPNPRNKGGATRWLHRQGVRVIGNVLQKECERIHEVFLVSIKKKRPFVVISTALSLDGKITWRKDATPVKFSSPESLQWAHRLRSRVDAVCVGIRTVEIDDPRLTARIPGGRNPHRVIIDSKCQLSSSARVFRATTGRVIVVTTAYAPIVRRQELEKKGAQVIMARETLDGRVDLNDAMRELYKQSINSIMIEGGGELNASALASGIVDKVYLRYSPLLIGGRDTPTAMEGEPLERFACAVKLVDLTTEKIGEDILVSGYIRGNE